MRMAANTVPRIKTVSIHEHRPMQTTQNCSMTSHIPTSSAIALLTQLLYDYQSLKDENSTLKLGYQELQRDATRRDAIINEQAKLLQSAGFSMMSNENPAMPSFVDGQLSVSPAFAQSSHPQGVAPIVCEGVDQGEPESKKKRKMSTEDDNKRHRMRG